MTKFLRLFVCTLIFVALGVSNFSVAKAAPACQNAACEAWQRIKPFIEGRGAGGVVYYTESSDWIQAMISMSYLPEGYSVEKLVADLTAAGFEESTWVKAGEKAWSLPAGWVDPCLPLPTPEQNLDPQPVRVQAPEFSPVVGLIGAFVIFVCALLVVRRLRLI